MALSGNDTIKSRAKLYRSLMEPFQFPAATSAEQFISGDWGQRVAATVESLNYELPLPAPLMVEPDDYQVAFISLHEVGMGGAPCPLHSGHYFKDRMRTLEEVVRFYRFFNFAPDRSPDRFPDHIASELEFMAHLADLQWRALTEGDDAESPLRAQRDFVTRHLASWLPQLTERVGQKTQIQFFSQVAMLSSAYAALDQNNLDEQVAEMNLSGEYEHG